MAVRIRKVEGVYVALCAATEKGRPGDIYLDDNIDRALRHKYIADFVTEGLITTSQVFVGDKIEGPPWCTCKAYVPGFDGICSTCNLPFNPGGHLIE